MTHLLEAGDNFGNIFDQGVKKNVAYPLCPLVEFNTTVQKKKLTYLIILHQFLQMKICLQFLIYVIITFLLCLQYRLQSLLSNLNIMKAPGPDHVPSYVLKHCAHKIAPILGVIFKIVVIFL